MNDKQGKESWKRREEDNKLRRARWSKGSEGKESERAMRGGRVRAVNYHYLLSICICGLARGNG